MSINNKQNGKEKIFQFLEEERMNRIIVKAGWLSKFLDKEGIDAYNSLIKSNNIKTKGEIFLVMSIKIPKGLITTKKKTKFTSLIQKNG